MVSRLYMGVCPALPTILTNAMLKAAATKTRACLVRERTARTQGAAAAGQAHFAAHNTCGEKQVVLPRQRV